jgi:mannose-6-phosphate isomerase-like protein (cupin superfamily)
MVLSSARKFSLSRVERALLIDAPDLKVELICFEAGQTLDPEKLATTSAYQVVEGEALVRVGDGVVRLGQGRLLEVPAATEHRLENAGGGLLVVIATRGA